MATLKAYRASGGFYIHCGKPIGGGHGEEDVIDGRVQLLPRAELFFETAGYRDGMQVEREVFYALLLDGDLSGVAIDRARPSVQSLPPETLSIAEALAACEGVLEFMRAPPVVACRHLVDYYRVIRKLRPTTKDATLAAYVCLVRHIRQAAYDRQQQR